MISQHCAAQKMKFFFKDYLVNTNKSVSKSDVVSFGKSTKFKQWQQAKCTRTEPFYRLAGLHWQIRHV